MYTKIKYPPRHHFEVLVKKMSIDELAALSAQIKQQSQELHEEMQVISESLIAKRIERVTRRLNEQHDDPRNND